MRILSLCFFLIVYGSLSAQDSWEPQTSGTVENLNSIYFFNGSTGFTAGNNATLLKTVDGGSSWTPVSITATSNFNQVYFKNNTDGFVLAQDGKIFRSSNSGTNWTGQTIHNSGLNGVDFNGDNGIVVGDDGHAFTSSDGGINWTDKGSLGVFTLNDVQFINDTLVVAVGASGSIYKSINKGNTWIAVPSGTTSTLSGIDRYSSELLFICGTNGEIMSFNPFTDETTSHASGLSTSWLKGIDCEAGADCYSPGTSKASLIYSNQSWISRSIDENVNLNDVSFVGDGVVYYCGIGGVIYKTTQGGYPISTEKISSTSISIAPNPAKDFIAVKSPFVTGTIKILDFTGKEIIITALSQPSQLITIRELPKGAYLVVISSNESTFVKKLFKK